MPLDTSTYHLAHLRLDGRRWNELRRIHGQISTQTAADGSSYLEMGNTKVICTVDGPTEIRGQGSAAGRQQQQDSNSSRDEATVTCEIGIAGFSGVDRKRRGRGDRRTLQIQSTLASTYQHTLFTHLYPHSTIALTIHVLSQDGSLLAACLNAATLALIDAGIPTRDYVAACTVGIVPSASVSASSANDHDDHDPLLDLNGQEEQEVPFLTVGTLGKGDRDGDGGGGPEGRGEGAKVVVCVLETKVQVARVEGMLAVGVDGCARVRGILDDVVREKGGRMLTMVTDRTATAAVVV